MATEAAWLDGNNLDKEEIKKKKKKFSASRRTTGDFLVIRTIAWARAQLSLSVPGVFINRAFSFSLSQCRLRIPLREVYVVEDYAKQIGLDTDRFSRDFSGEEVSRRIFQDGKRGHALGVSGTPSFFVNGKELKEFSIDALRDLVKQAVNGANNQ